MSDKLELFDIFIIDFETELCLKNVGFFLVSDIEIFWGNFTHEIRHESFFREEEFSKLTLKPCNNECWAFF